MISSSCCIQAIPKDQSHQVIAEPCNTVWKTILLDLVKVNQKHGNQNKKIVKKKKFKNFAYLEYHELYLISEFFIYILFFFTKKAIIPFISWILIHLTVQVICVWREILVNHANENGIHFPIMDKLESSEVFWG